MDNSLTPVTRQEATNIDRRSVLRASAGVIATGAGGTLVGRASAGGGDNGDYPVPSDFPVITTREQFTEDGTLKEGYTRNQWAWGGDWRKWGRKSPRNDEILIVVHGWNWDQPGGKDVANTTRIALRNNGYQQFVVGFSWDSDKGGGIDQGWNEGVTIARKNGPKLASWIAGHNDRNGGPIRIIGHSLGARVTAEALAELYRRGQVNAVESVTLLGGAIDDQEVEMDQRYGPAIESVTKQFHNVYDTDDQVLNWAYSTLEFEGAVGEEGIQNSGDAPSNYSQTDVTGSVPDHNSYYEPSEGCLGTVVDAF